MPLSRHLHRVCALGVVICGLWAGLVGPWGRALGQSPPAVSAASPAQGSEAGAFQAYPVQHQRASDLAKGLAEMLRHLGPASRVVPDVEGNQILVRGPEAAHQITRAYLQSVDRPPVEAPRSGAVVRAYPCPSVWLDETAARLRARYGGYRDVRVTVDAGTAQVIVLAPPEIQSRIAQEIPRPNAAAAGSPKPQAPPAPPPGLAGTAAGLKQQFVAVSHMPMGRMEPQLRQILGPRLEPVAGRDPQRPVYRFQDAASRQVTVTCDYQRRGVHLVGPEVVVLQLARLIAALDAIEDPGPGPQVRIIPVRRADPAKVREAVEAYRRGSGGAGARPVPEAPAPRQTGQTPPAARRGVALAQYAAPAADPAAAPTPTPSPAETAPEEEAAQAPAQLERLRELGENVQVETLPDLDVIILRGRDVDIDEVSRIIAELERLSAETVPQIDVYQLRYIHCVSLATILEMVAQDLTGGRQGKAHVTPLVKPNAMLIIGWGEAVKAIKELIAKLDQPVSPETQMRVYRLRHAPASTASQVIQEAFADPQGLGPLVEVTVDARTNSLIVRASPRDLAEVDHLLSRIDQGQSGAVSQARIFKLNNALANDLAATLQSAVSAAAGGVGAAAGQQKSTVLELLTADVQGQRILKSGILSDVQITPDPHTNTLLITAPAESMDLLAALIEQLDSPTAVAQIKVFKVVNGDATSLVEMLRTLLPTQAGVPGPQLAGAEGETTLVPVRFSVEPRTNSIIATGSEGDLAIIEALLLRLDAEEVEERKNEVYHLKNAPAMDVAQAINEFLRTERQLEQAAPGVISPFEQIEREVVIVAEPVSNALIISATPRYFDEVLQLVEQLDAQPPQVMIQVVIAEVDLGNIDEFGVELGIQDSILFDRSLLEDLNLTTRTSQQSTDQGIITITEQIIQSATNTPGFEFNNVPLGNSGSDKSLATAGIVGAQALSHFLVGRTSAETSYGGLVLSASSENVSLLLRALQETRRLEVLSRPQIMTLDNQPAFIQVGKRVPRIEAARFDVRTQINSIVLENTGLILGVTPRISPEGMVVMEIDAEKSDLGPEQEGTVVSVIDGNPIRQPAIETTLAQTTVSAADGETIVLGGLITKSTSVVNRRVPLLSDVPILGSLFRFDGEVKKRSELLIILTPHVVRSSEEAERIKRQEAARISWTLADVHQMHGPTGIYEDQDPSVWSGQGEVIYPDVNPEGQVPGTYTPGEVPLEQLQLSPAIEQLPTPGPVPMESAPPMPPPTRSPQPPSTPPHSTQLPPGSAQQAPIPYQSAVRPGPQTRLPQSFQPTPAPSFPGSASVGPHSVRPIKTAPSFPASAPAASTAPPGAYPGPYQPAPSTASRPDQLPYR